MEELRYSALDLAVIINDMELGCKQESRVIDDIWEGERSFLSAKHQDNQRKFILDIRYWINYLYEKPTFDREFLSMNKDIMSSNSILDKDQYMADFSNLDLFFKSIRIRILYGNEKSYIKIKLRTLLKQYGYQRRSQQLIQHISRCMEFYHLKAFLRGGTACNIADVGLDHMIIFRVGAR